MTLRTLIALCLSARLSVASEASCAYKLSQFFATVSVDVFHEDPSGYSVYNGTMMWMHDGVNAQARLDKWSFARRGGRGSSGVLVLTSLEVHRGGATYTIVNGPFPKNCTVDYGPPFDSTPCTGHATRWMPSDEIVWSFPCNDVAQPDATIDGVDCFVFGCGHEPDVEDVHRVYISKASGMPVLETATGPVNGGGSQSATIRFTAYNTGNEDPGWFCTHPGCPMSKPASCGGPLVEQQTA